MDGGALEDSMEPPLVTPTAPSGKPPPPDATLCMGGARLFSGACSLGGSGGAVGSPAGFCIAGCARSTGGGCSTTDCIVGAAP